MEKSGEKFDGNYAELFNKSYYGEGKLERERERERARIRPKKLIPVFLLRPKKKLSIPLSPSVLTYCSPVPDIPDYSACQTCIYLNSRRHRTGTGPGKL
jgi:hypothetical protein